MSNFSVASFSARPTGPAWTPAGEAERSICVLMSGGVDSSVTALLLREAGWRVLGVTMQTTSPGQCSSGDPAELGARAARALGVAHYVLDVREAFDQIVLGPFREQYLRGRTPNPCVGCNAFLKFGQVWDFVERTFGVRHLATGHYARIERASGRSCLRRGADPRRDQSYFLYWIPRRRLDFLEFPLGASSKDETRALARAHGLPAAETSDSMDFCVFGRGGDYRDYLIAHDPAARRPGPILDSAGREIGRHEGLFNYTLGQRKGLPATGEPVYVTALDTAANAVRVGPREAVFTRRVQTETANLLLPERVRPGERLFGKIRSMGEPSPCVVAAADEKSLTVDFDNEQFAPAPGQHLALYDEQGRVAGGGVIAPANR